MNESIDYGEISQLVEKAARLIYFRFETKKNLKSNSEFQMLVRDYESNETMREFVNNIANAFECSIPVVNKTGIFFYPDEGSAFCIKMEDIPTFRKEENREIFIIILSAIGAFYYPTAESFYLGQESYVELTKTELYDFVEASIKDIVGNSAIDKVSKNLGKQENTSNLETHNKDEIGGENKLSIEKQKLYEVFRKIHKISNNPNSNMMYFIDRTLDFLIKQKLIFQKEEKYYPSHQFKYQLKELAKNPYFISFQSILNEKRRVQKKVPLTKNETEKPQTIRDDNELRPNPIESLRK